MNEEVIARVSIIAHKLINYIHDIDVDHINNDDKLKFDIIKIVSEVLGKMPYNINIIDKFVATKMIEIMFVVLIGISWYTIFIQVSPKEAYASIYKMVGSIKVEK